MRRAGKAYSGLIAAIPLTSRFGVVLIAIKWKFRSEISTYIGISFVFALQSAYNTVEISRQAVISDISVITTSVTAILAL